MGAMKLTRRGYSLHQSRRVWNEKRRTEGLRTKRRWCGTWGSPTTREGHGDGAARVASQLVTKRSAAGGQTQEMMVDTEVEASHRGSRVEKTLASGEPGAWKSCMPGFGGGRLEKGGCKSVPRRPPILQR